jgi:antirestriction protein
VSAHLDMADNPPGLLHTAQVPSPASGCAVVTRLFARRVWVCCTDCTADGLLAGGWYDDHEVPHLDIDDVCASVSDSHVEVRVVDQPALTRARARDGSPADTALVVALVDDLSEGHSDAYRAWLDHTALDLSDESGWEFRDLYRGCWDSKGAYALYYAQTIGEVPAELHWPLDCIDWEAAAGDLFTDGPRYALKGSRPGLHVFARQ